ncbi:hypothetical protein [Nibricoccus sp. IMCC34717]|uniref:hypothetical protein n=1 Tax=Nibricoccus sp. IMCC34717 TaxID=3034021 RepID=UPI00384D081D
MRQVVPYGNPDERAHAGYLPADPTQIRPARCFPFGNGFAAASPGKSSPGPDADCARRCQAGGVVARPCPRFSLPPTDPDRGIASANSEAAHPGSGCRAAARFLHDSSASAYG